MDLRTRRHVPKSHARSRVRSSVAPLLLALGLAVAAQVGLAQKAHPAESYDGAERLTRSLGELNVRHRGATAAERARLSGALLSVAASRLQLLSDIIQDDPKAVLRAAVSAEFRASLPPAVWEYVEEEMDVEGGLEVLHER